MSVVLWPRQEVLQLVIPQLGEIGRILTNASATLCVKKLAKHQTIEGKISYDRWLIVAKDCLKWNDNCIQLFWEMLCLAVYYLNRDSVLYTDRESFSVDLEFIAIFLVLHAAENQSSKSITSKAGYDTAWPSMPTELEQQPVSPISSPSKARKFPNIGSPLSPRSPKQSPRLSPKPASPSGRASPTSSPGSKRAFFNGSRTPRSTAQYLHSVRQKIPVILRALGDVDQHFDALAASGGTPSTPERDDGDGNASSSGGLIDFAVSRKTVDCLGLVVCGGRSREEHVSTLSLLHPSWSAEAESHIPSGTGSSSSSTANLLSGASFSLSDSPFNTGSTVAYSDLAAWFNLHLSMNDLLYPVSVSANYSAAAVAPSPSHHAMQMELAEVPPAGGGMADSAVNAKSFQPSRTLTPVSSLTRFAPTVISHCCTTVMHVVTSSPSRAPSFRRINSTRSQDSSCSNGFAQSLDSVLDQNTFNNSGNQRQVLSDIVDADASNHGRAPARSIDSADLGVTVGLQHSPLMGQGRGTSSFDSSSRMDEDSPAPSTATAAAAGSEDDSSKYDLSHDPKFRETFLSSSSTAGAAAGDDQHISHAMASGMWSGNAFSSSGSSSMQHPELTLPQLFLSECKQAQLYLISPYYSASLTGLEDCEVVIGAVFGAVILNGCERVRVTCACRKLIVLNCLDCEFSVATLSSTIIGGDSRGLTFGPYNTSYRNLKNHLKLADLQPLAVSAGDDRAESQSNCWASLCDVNACLEAVATSSSPAGYAVDAMAASCSMLPTPSGTTATFMQPERFRCVAVPFKQEFLSYEYCAIAVPPDFTECLAAAQRELVHKVRGQIASVVSDLAPTLPASPGGGDEEKRDGRSIAAAAITKKFMEWLTTSEHAQEVLDLIRIDSEKNSGNAGDKAAKP